MSATVYGRVLCNGKYHRITRDGDIWETPGCPNAHEEAKRIAGMAALGGAVAVDDACGCAQIIALCIGLPRVIARGGMQTSQLGVWRDLYIKYESNGLVLNARRAAFEAFEAAHHDTLNAARRALLRTSYWRGSGVERSDILLMTSFVPSAKIEPGAIVALERTLDWEIPLQEGWLERVGPKRAVVDGKLIVGVSEEPDTVYALDRERGGDSIVVEKFKKVSRKNRSILERAS